MKFLVTESQLKEVVSKLHLQLESFIFEGQNEDRAKQILTSTGMANSDEIFSFLKNIDKSKNNKLLPVITTFYVNAKNNDEYSLIVNTFKELFNEKTIPEITLNKDGDVVVLGNVFEKNNFEDFKDFINHYTYKEEDYTKELEKEESRKKEQETELVSVDANKIFENENFIVWKAIHEKICIQLFGRDNEDRLYPISDRPFCIGWGSLADPATHLRGYRTGDKKYTFYAVLDKKRYKHYSDTNEMTTSMLNIVGVKPDGTFNVWNERDDTDDLRPGNGYALEGFSSPQEYLNYLENGGINIRNLFKVIPYVPSVDELITSLNNEPNREEYFRAMSPFLKREYLKQAKTLTPKQVKFFVGTNDIKTLEKFVKNYTTIKEISKEAFLLLPFNLQKSFLRSKLIQLANRSNNFNFDSLFNNYIVDPKHEEYAITFLKDSFEKNKNQNQELSLKILGLLSPIDFFESVKSVTKLDINQENFRSSKLPENFGEYITNLTHLEIENLENITSIPESIGMAKNLIHLQIKNCNQLTTIPASIGELTNLEYLGIINNSNLTSIPDTIGNLRNLDHIGLINDTSLTEIPESIGNLESLIAIALKGTPLKKLPVEELKNLPFLTFLTHDEVTLSNLSEEEIKFLENFSEDER